MPNSLQTLDTSFPKIDNHQTTEENFAQVTNYLYMLLENLRYTLGNLGAENFNDTELDSIGYWIRQPVMIRLEDTEKNVASLDIEAAKISSRLEDAEGNINSINATATGYYARIESAEGNITSLTATAENLSGQISSLDGSMVSIQATAHALTAQVSDAEKNIASLSLTAQNLSLRIEEVDTGIGTKITQSIKGITLSAENGEGNSSTLKLMYNGTELASPSITFNGFVTVTDLATSGKTTIHGGNLQSGTVTADKLRGQTLQILSGATEVAKMQLEITNNPGLTLHSNYALRLTAARNVYIESTAGGTSLQFLSDDFASAISASCTYFLGSGTGTNLGAEGRKWNNIYANTGPWSTSDERDKNSIEVLPEKYLDFFDLLTPRRFKLNDGTSDRYHVGFIAQEVEAAMAWSGVEPAEFGGFGIGYSPDGQRSYYMLRYEEYIAILAAKIKQLEERMS